MILLSAARFSVPLFTPAVSMTDKEAALSSASALVSWAIFTGMGGAFFSIFAFFLGIDGQLVAQADFRI
jgi:hypothetical protein